jgi:S1-C subfamily serine protease
VSILAGAFPQKYQRLFLFSGGIMRDKQIHTPMWLAAAVLAVVLVFGGIAGALTMRHGSAAGFAAPVSVSAASSDQARIGETFAPIVQADAPAVVNISSSRKVQGPTLNPFSRTRSSAGFLVTSFPNYFARHESVWSEAWGPESSSMQMAIS